jgi:hypothetical protein
MISIKAVSLSTALSKPLWKGSGMRLMYYPYTFPLQRKLEDG